MMNKVIRLFMTFNFLHLKVEARKLKCFCEISIFFNTVAVLTPEKNQGVIGKCGKVFHFMKTFNYDDICEPKCPIIYEL